MTRLLEFIDYPVLPYDVLRLVFEEATRADRGKAAKYTLISKLVCNWVENWLYSDVKLYSEKSLRKFLRTLESSTKPNIFFATHVKSLAIAYDASDLECTAKILSACNGVETLTIWAIPSIRSSFLHQNMTVHNAVGLVRGPMPLPVPSAHQIYDRSNSLYATFANYLRPKHLSVLIDSPLYVQQLPYSPQFDLAPVISPDFSLGLFSNLTHLSIVNRWTEWSTWAWSSNPNSPHDDDTMEQSNFPTFPPKLTHLSLEIQVGKQSTSKPFVPPPPTTTMTASPPPLRRIQKLAELVSLPLAAILELNPRLCVLLCVLCFDEEPHRTAQLIRQRTYHHLSALRNKQQTHRVELDYPGDPRLVFAYDREPFKEREAGSSKVWDMWERAEDVVRLQRYDDPVVSMYDPVVFDL